MPRFAYYWLRPCPRATQIRARYPLIIIILIIIIIIIIVIIIVIIIIIIIIIIITKPFIDNKANYKILFTINFT